MQTTEEEIQINCETTERLKNAISHRYGEEGSKILSVQQEQRYHDRSQELRTTVLDSKVVLTYKCYVVFFRWPLWWDHSYGSFWFVSKQCMVRCASLFLCQSNPNLPVGPWQWYGVGLLCIPDQSMSRFSRMFFIVFQVMSWHSYELTFLSDSENYTQDAF